MDKQPYCIDLIQNEGNKTAHVVYNLLDDPLPFVSYTNVVLILSLRCCLLWFKFN